MGDGKIVTICTDVVSDFGPSGSKKPISNTKYDSNNAAKVQFILELVGPLAHKSTLQNIKEYESFRSNAKKNDGVISPTNSLIH